MNSSIPIQAPEGFNWASYGAYRAFDSFIETFVIRRRSLITNHQQKLNLEEALEDIKRRFVDDFDKGQDDFDSKARGQFEGASDNTLIVFAHAEYLWCMPSGSMRPPTKRDYAKRWFSDEMVKSGDELFFWKLEGIASPGQYYQTNKYQELRCVFGVLHHLVTSSSLSNLVQIKEEIATLCFQSLYGKPADRGGFEVKDYCGVNAALLHLSKPDHFQSILSKGHKEQISSFFDYLISDCSESLGLEEKLNLIKSRAYADYNVEEDEAYKYRHFYYCSSVENLWLKSSARQRNQASIYNEILREELAPSFETEEGERTLVQREKIYRCPKIVKAVKERDSYTCQACGFYFQKQIVHVHHLNPLAERSDSEATSEDDLVTLCPNCHYLAHFLLRKKKGGDQYRNKEVLLKKLKTITPVKQSS